MKKIERKDYKRELIAEIRNKLTAPKATLQLLSQGKDVPKKFIKKVLKELNKAIELLKDLN